MKEVVALIVAVSLLLTSCSVTPGINGGVGEYVIDPTEVMKPETYKNDKTGLTHTVLDWKNVTSLESSRQYTSLNYLEQLYLEGGLPYTTMLDIITGKVKLPAVVLTFQHLDKEIDTVFPLRYLRSEDILYPEYPLYPFNLYSAKSKESVNWQVYSNGSYKVIVTDIISLDGQPVPSGIAVSKYLDRISTRKPPVQTPNNRPDPYVPNHGKKPPVVITDLPEGGIPFVPPTTEIVPPVVVVPKDPEPAEPDKPTPEVPDKPTPEVPDKPTPETPKPIDPVTPPTPPVPPTTPPVKPPTTDKEKWTNITLYGADDKERSYFFRAEYVPGIEGSGMYWKIRPVDEDGPISNIEFVNDFTKMEKFEALTQGRPSFDFRVNTRVRRVNRNGKKYVIEFDKLTKMTEMVGVDDTKVIPPVRGEVPPKNVNAYDDILAGIPTMVPMYVEGEGIDSRLKIYSDNIKSKPVHLVLQTRGDSPYDADFIRLKENDEVLYAKVIPLIKSIEYDDEYVVYVGIDPSVPKKYYTGLRLTEDRVHPADEIREKPMVALEELSEETNPMSSYIGERKTSVLLSSPFDGTAVTVNNVDNGKQKKLYIASSLMAEQEDDERTMAALKHLAGNYVQLTYNSTRVTTSDTQKLYIELDNYTQISLVNNSGSTKDWDSVFNSNGLKEEVDNSDLELHIKNKSVLGEYYATLHSKDGNVYLYNEGTKVHLFGDQEVVKYLKSTDKKYVVRLYNVTLLPDKTITATVRSNHIHKTKDRLSRADVEQHFSTHTTTARNHTWHPEPGMSGRTYLVKFNEDKRLVFLNPGHHIGNNYYPTVVFEEAEVEKYLKETQTPFYIKNGAIKNDLMSLKLNQLTLYTGRLEKYINLTLNTIRGPFSLPIPVLDKIIDGQPFTETVNATVKEDHYSTFFLGTPRDFTDLRLEVGMTADEWRETKSLIPGNYKLYSGEFTIKRESVGGPVIATPNLNRLAIFIEEALGGIDNYQNLVNEFTRNGVVPNVSERKYNNEFKVVSSSNNKDYTLTGTAHLYQNLSKLEYQIEVDGLDDNIVYVHLKDEYFSKYRRLFDHVGFDFKATKVEMTGKVKVYKPGKVILIPDMSRTKIVEEGTENFTDIVRGREYKESTDDSGSLDIQVGTRKQFTIKLAESGNDKRIVLFVDDQQVILNLSFEMSTHIDAIMRILEEGKLITFEAEVTSVDKANRRLGLNVDSETVAIANIAPQTQALLNQFKTIDDKESYTQNTPAKLSEGTSVTTYISKTRDGFELYAPQLTAQEASFDYVFETELHEKYMKYMPLGEVRAVDITPSNLMFGTDKNLRTATITINDLKPANNVKVKEYFKYHGELGYLTHVINVFKTTSLEQYTNGYNDDMSGIGRSMYVPRVTLVYLNNKYYIYNPTANTKEDLQEVTLNLPTALKDLVEREGENVIAVNYEEDPNYSSSYVPLFVRGYNQATKAHIINKVKLLFSTTRDKAVETFRIPLNTEEVPYTRVTVYVADNRLVIYNPEQSGIIQEVLTPYGGTPLYTKLRGSRPVNVELRLNIRDIVTVGNPRKLKIRYLADFRGTKDNLSTEEEIKVINWYNNKYKVYEGSYYNKTLVQELDSSVELTSIEDSIEGASKGFKLLTVKVTEDFVYLYDTTKTTPQKLKVNPENTDEFREVINSDHKGIFTALFKYDYTTDTYGVITYLGQPRKLANHAEVSRWFSSKVVEVKPYSYYKSQPQVPFNLNTSTNSESYQVYKDGEGNWRLVTLEESKENNQVLKLLFDDSMKAGIAEDSEYSDNFHIRVTVEGDSKSTQGATVKNIEFIRDEDYRKVDAFLEASELSTKEARLERFNQLFNVNETPESVKVNFQNFTSGSIVRLPIKVDLFNDKITYVGLEGADDKYVTIEMNESDRKYLEDYGWVVTDIQIDDVTTSGTRVKVRAHLVNKGDLQSTPPSKTFVLDRLISVNWKATGDAILGYTYQGVSRLNLNDLKAKITNTKSVDVTLDSNSWKLNTDTIDKNAVVEVTYKEPWMQSEYLAKIAEFGTQDPGFKLIFENVSVEDNGKAITKVSGTIIGIQAQKSLGQDYATTLEIENSLNGKGFDLNRNDVYTFHVNGYVRKDIMYTGDFSDRVHRRDTDLIAALRKKPDGSYERLVLKAGGKYEPTPINFEETNFSKYLFDVLDHPYKVVYLRKGSSYGNTPYRISTEVLSNSYLGYLDESNIFIIGETQEQIDLNPAERSIPNIVLPVTTSRVTFKKYDTAIVVFTGNSMSKQVIRIDNSAQGTEQLRRLPNGIYNATVTLTDLTEDVDLNNQVYTVTAKLTNVENIKAVQNEDQVRVWFDTTYQEYGTNPISIEQQLVNAPELDSNRLDSSLEQSLDTPIVRLLVYVKEDGNVDYFTDNGKMPAMSNVRQLEYLKEVRNTEHKGLFVGRFKTQSGTNNITLLRVESKIPSTDRTDILGFFGVTDTGNPGGGSGSQQSTARVITSISDLTTGTPIRVSIKKETGLDNMWLHTRGLKADVTLDTESANIADGFEDANPVVTADIVIREVEESISDSGKYSIKLKLDSISNYEIVTGDTSDLVADMQDNNQWKQYPAWSIQQELEEANPVEIYEYEYAEMYAPNFDAIFKVKDSEPNKIFILSEGMSHELELDTTSYNNLVTVTDGENNIFKARFENKGIVKYLGLIQRVNGSENLGGIMPASLVIPEDVNVGTEESTDNVTTDGLPEAVKPKEDEETQYTEEEEVSENDPPQETEQEATTP